MKDQTAVVPRTTGKNGAASDVSPGDVLPGAPSATPLNWWERLVRVESTDS